MKTIFRLLAPLALTLVPSACSLIADVDRSKITDDDDSGEGGSPTGGTSGKGGASGTGGSGGKGGTSAGGTSGTGGGSGGTAAGSGGTGDAGTSGTGGESGAAGTAGTPEGGTGGESDTGSGGAGAGEAGSGGVPDTAGMGGAGGESGAGGGCEVELCGEACIDTSVNTAHCGACNRACSNVNTSALACATGQCAPTCAAGYGDCSPDDGTGADDGCETNLNDNATCGTSCGNPIACGANEVCVAGVCENQCQSPDTECGTACVNLDTRLDHCGECDRACSTNNTTGTACVGGECAPTCNAGFDDCLDDDGSGPDDGCETNIASSASHCNACNRACSTANASDTACASGVCAPSCDPDYADCDVDDGSGDDDGCETDLAGDAANCNACGRACSEAGASDTACFDGRCDPTCSAGFDDCVPDGDGSGPDDGCETALATSDAHCNACGRACSSANTFATACDGGVCEPTCNLGFGDCSADDGTGADDGCETDFNAPATCGTSCANMVACTGGQTCILGLCVGAG